MAKTNAKMNDPKLREDIASFKASLAFIIFCVFIFLTVSHFENNKGMYEFRNYLDSNAWLLLIPFAVFAVSAVLRILAAVKQCDESYSYFSSHDFLGLSSLLLVYCLTFAATTNILMYSIVIVGFAIGYYAKRFFGMDFYALTILNLAIAFGLWLKFGSKGWSSLSAFSASGISKVLLAVGVVVVALLIVGFAVSVLLFGKKGKRTVFDKAVCIFGITEKNTDFSKLCMIPMIISVILGIALVLVLRYMPQYMTLLVAEIILLVQYVALGVFYTVRLINQ